ncbi:hypothetical protein [Bdellovibrio sp. HCB-110]|uniref:hypothetical protein n=1 Tax=Bdellovibrio sp. HCB-110 TaxID=3391182 RepID=UPI0039B4A1DF
MNIVRGSFVLKSLSSLFASVIFLLTSCTHAPTKVQYTETDRPVPVSPKERIPAADELDWWAAKAQHVKNAVCRIQLPKTTSEIEKYYNSIPVGPNFEGGTSEISGVRLIDEKPHLVLALAKLLTPARESMKIEDAPKNFQEKFKVNPSCMKALCAAQKIFGKDVGPQMLFLMDKYDVNTSPYSFINADTFNASEIADVIRSFELVHPDQLPFGFNKQLIKFKRGYTRASYKDGEGTVLANAAIELFDGWSEQTSLMRQYTLYHEIAHNHSDNQFADYDRSASWLALSDWKENKPGEFANEKQKAMQGHPFVSKYGETNPFEDFAESVSSFRLNPQLLKSKSLDKYNLIKLYVFDGLEYTSEANCRKAPLNVQYQKQIDRDGGALSAADKLAVKNACRQSFYQTVLGHIPVSFFSACVNYGATQIWQKQNTGRFADLTPQALFDTKLRISNLKFNALKNELRTELAPELTDWILQSMNVHSYKMTSQMSNTEYCDVWSELSHRVYPDAHRNNQWYRNGIFLSRDYSPHAGAARGLCLDLVQGFTPTSKSSVSTIKNWVKAKAAISTESQITERGITRESLLKYISDRTNH